MGKTRFLVEMIGDRSSFDTLVKARRYAMRKVKPGDSRAWISTYKDGNIGRSVGMVYLGNGGVCWTSDRKYWILKNDGTLGKKLWK